MQDLESEDWFKPYEEEGGEAEEEDFDTPQPLKEEKRKDSAPGRGAKRSRRAGWSQKAGRILAVLPWLFSALLSVFVFTNSVRISNEGRLPLKESLSYLNGEVKSASNLRSGLSSLGEEFPNLSASPSSNFVENILSVFSLKSAVKADLSDAASAESLKLSSALAEARAILKGAPPSGASSSLASLVKEAQSRTFAPTLASLRQESALISSLSSLSGSVALQRSVGKGGK